MTIVTNGNAGAGSGATAARSEGLPHDAPHWTHYETDLSSVLAFAPRGMLLEIVRIADEVARGYCARLGLEPGDRVTRLDGGRDDVVLTTDDGRRVRLELPVALLVEVRPALRS